MLTKPEEKVAREFFADMCFSDLACIAKSVTKSNLSPSNFEDAIRIICQHSGCIESILEKKKVPKRYICEYLHKKNVSIENSWNKPALIRLALEYWKIDAKSSIREDDADADDEVPGPSQSQSSLSFSSKSSEEDEFYSSLCREFSKWYYSMVNDDDTSKLGPEHFFDESQLQVAVLDGESTDTLEAANSRHVVDTLRELKLRYNLKYLPNLAPDSLRFQRDIHGQVMLFVCGTLYSNTNDVVGVFEQMFLLIRDFADNKNWKIKNSRVMLRSSNNAIKSSEPTNDDTTLAVRS